MKNVVDFLHTWKDTKSIERMRRSDKSRDVQKAEIENHLKAMSNRFERSPQAGTLQNWASDIVNSGYEEWMVEAVCKIIPFKLERHPTLSQIMELLRPYAAQKEAPIDELDKYTQIVIPHLKGKFIALVGIEVYERMLRYYRAEVFPDLQVPVEMTMLGDWCRSYMSNDPAKIIEQGKISNEAAARGDRDYFLAPLRQYAVKNNLA